MVKISRQKGDTTIKHKVSILELQYGNGQVRKCVQKVYAGDNSKIAVETRVLDMLRQSNITVPKIINKNGTRLVLEYIEGSLLVDFCSEQEKVSSNDTPSAEVLKVIRQLSDWLKAFYETTHKAFGRQMVLGDPNFRNFIVNDEIYGFDFEDILPGIVENNISRICAYALTYDPPFTAWKYEFITEFISAMELVMRIDREEVLKGIPKELELIRTRRQSKKAGIGHERG